MALSNTKRGTQRTGNPEKSAASASSPPPTAAAAPLALAHGEPVNATTPTVTLQGMQPGSYIFELVVTDDLGIASPPVRLTVEVTGTTSTQP